MNEITAAQLAAILGVARSHITRLKQHGKLTPNAKGKFDLGAAVREYIAFLKAGKYAAVVSDRRAKLLAQQERRLTLQNDENEGKLITIEEFDQVLTFVISTMATALNGFGSRHAAVLAGMSDAAQVKRYLDSELDRVRAAAAKTLEDHARQKAAEAG
jgi:phage terminase Nu1 subunit (DNA packaging protein)